VRTARIPACLCCIGPSPVLWVKYTSEKYHAENNGVLNGRFFSNP
jgi:hypothetical protein